MKETSFLLFSAVTAFMAFAATLTQSGRMDARQVTSTEHLPEQPERSVKSEGDWPPPEDSILWVDTAGNLGFRPSDVIYVPAVKTGEEAWVPRRCLASVKRNRRVGAATLCLPDASLYLFFRGGDR